MNEHLNDNIEKNEILFQSKKIAETLESLGEDFGFDKDTCDEIAEMSFDDAFETSYSYLVQAGLDPEEVLADFMEASEQIAEDL